MKKENEEGAGSAGASPGPKTAREFDFEELAISRCDSVHVHYFKHPKTRQDRVNLMLEMPATYWPMIRDLLLSTMAKRSGAPNPSSGEGPSPSTPDRTTDVTHPHPGEGRP